MSSALGRVTVCHAAGAGAGRQPVPEQRGRCRGAERKRREALVRHRDLVGGGGRRPQRILQLVIPDLPQQRARADPQELGGPLPVARGLDQALLDRLTLELGQRDPRAVMGQRLVRR